MKKSFYMNYITYSLVLGVFPFTICSW